MAQTITAIYEHGVLRPLTPLQLPEQSRVELDVRTVSSAESGHPERQMVQRALAKAGLLASLPPTTSSPLSEAERAALAAELVDPQAPTLSHIISEERAGR